ncbi:EscU/YscU/HrcU family type III secretion system export apparatus switch protein [Planctomicrobium sp. SH668]|uniref:EscU/YscU/HrcU family type III secretion system export apparatus switch protein n=1 Tax=Planctomicrobium sp. SH668 TaxID=3448126 RepID=UPI003F5AEDAE
MAESTNDNKTEDPTPHRRETAREDGQVVYSPDLNSAVAIFFVAVASLWMVPLMIGQTQRILSERIVTLDGSDWTVASTQIAGQWFFNHLWGIAGVASVIFLGINLLLSQIQVGFLITPKPLVPKWEKLDMAKGFQKIFSLESVVRGMMAVLKVSTLGIVSCVVCYLWRNTLQKEAHGPVIHSVVLGWEMLIQLMMSLAGTALLWGITDYCFKWYRNEQKLRMSKQEVKDEQKSENGDPQVKSRIRRMQREASQRKSLKDVPRASVVITNPTHYAVALRYESGVMSAPKVIAKGSGAFAKRIAATAREHGVPVLERKPLTRALYALAEVGKEIPLEYFRAVAEILAYVYRIKNGLM